MGRRGGGQNTRTGFDIVVDRLVVSFCFLPEVVAKESRLPVLGVILHGEGFHAGDRLCRLEKVDREKVQEVRVMGKGGLVGSEGNEHSFTGS